MLKSPLPSFSKSLVQTGEPSSQIYLKFEQRFVFSSPHGLLHGQNCFSDSGADVLLVVSDIFSFS